MHPMVEYAVPIVLTVLVAITGIVILLVRINHIVFNLSILRMGMVRTAMEPIRSIEKMIEQ